MEGCLSCLDLIDHIIYLDRSFDFFWVSQYVREILTVDPLETECLIIFQKLLRICDPVNHANIVLWSHPWRGLVFSFIKEVQISYFRTLNFIWYSRNVLTSSKAQSSSVILYIIFLQLFVSAFVVTFMWCFFDGKCGIMIFKQYFV